MEAYGARYVIAVDHGCRGGGPIVRSVQGWEVKSLVIDHHWSDEFPEGAMVSNLPAFRNHNSYTTIQVLSAARYPPVATSSTLAYLLCLPLHPAIQAQTDYLCAIGTMGDLGSGMKWVHPWPEDDMRDCNKKYSKKVLSDAVRLINARMCSDGLARRLLN